MGFLLTKNVEKYAVKIFLHVTKLMKKPHINLHKIQIVIINCSFLFSEVLLTTF